MKLTPRWRAVGGVLVIALFGAVPSVASAAGLGQASPSSGRLDVFLRHDGDGTATDPNRDSVVQVSRIDNRWQSPRNLGGYVHPDGEISAASPSADRLDIAVRWSDNTLRTRTWTVGYGWGGWANLGGNVTAGPAVAAYGTGKLALVWRDGSSAVRIRTASTSTAWSTSTALSGQSAKAGTGFALAGTPGGGLSLQYDKYLASGTGEEPVTTSMAAGSDPTLSASWTAPTLMFPTEPSSLGTVTPARAVVQRTATTLPAGTGAEMFWGAAYSDRAIQRLFPAFNGNPQTFLGLGGVVAGSPATSRPGESTRPNTVAATWSDQLRTGTPILDLIWRTDDGCLTGKTKTNTSINSGTYSAPVRVPTQRTTTRCVWPNRTGTVPVLKRLNGADGGDFASAHDAWINNRQPGNPAQDWYTASKAALVLHQGANWATSWAPRNWHPDTWVYRKSTTYGAYDGFHTDPATAGIFVRTTGDNKLMALNSVCSSSGCTQPLLNVTSSAARTFWLKGADGKVAYLDTNPDGTPMTPPGCHGNPDANNVGVLDLLACNWGEGAWAADNRGNYKGVWLDDVLTDLVNPDHLDWNTIVADFQTGVPLTGNEVLAKLPFTPAAWRDSIATMLEDLRTGINQLKGVGRLRPSEGKVAINYKWSTNGFAEADTTPPISATSPDGRIIRAADLIDLEGGWLENIRPDNAQRWSFARRQSFVDQVHGPTIDRRVIEEKANCGAFVLRVQGYVADCSRENTPNDAPTHYLSSQYNLANLLLNFKSGDWVGDGSDYLGRSWKGYELDLGAAIGTRSTINAPVTNLPAGAPARTEPVQQRLFDRGRVIVVPPLASAPFPDVVPEPTPRTDWGPLVTIPVPNGSRWYVSGTNTLSTVTNGSISLYSRQAAVILAP